MFDNIGTALIQAIGFFGVFGFFVYQLLSETKNKGDFQIKSRSKKVNNSRDFEKPKKKGLFAKKTETVNNLEKPKKKGLFAKKTETLNKLEKPKKKSWFN